MLGSEELEIDMVMRWGVRILCEHIRLDERLRQSCACKHCRALGHIFQSGLDLLLMIAGHSNLFFDLSSSSSLEKFFILT